MARLIILIMIAAAVYLLIKPQSPMALLRGMRPILTVILALLYLASPIDIIPDFGPVGFLDDIIVLLSALWWASEQARQRQPQGQRGNGQRRTQSPPRREPCDAQWDPYAVLGIERGASPEEITHAYREQMKRYHPDRVNGLGEELQKVAHEKTLEIQRAYEELK